MADSVPAFNLIQHWVDVSYEGDFFKPMAIYKKKCPKFILYHKLRTTRTGHVYICMYVCGLSCH